jgi:hypothetical protein
MKTSQLMLYSEIIAVCSQIHTKLWGQNVEFLGVKTGGIYSNHCLLQRASKIRDKDACSFSPASFRRSRTQLRGETLLCVWHSAVGVADTDVSWLMLGLVSVPSMAESAGSRILVQANFISHVVTSQQNVRKIRMCGSNCISTSDRNAASQLITSCHLCVFLSLPCAQHSNTTNLLERMFMLGYDATVMDNVILGRYWLRSFETSESDYPMTSRRTPKELNFRNFLSLLLSCWLAVGTQLATAQYTWKWQQSRLVCRKITPYSLVEFRDKLLPLSSGYKKWEGVTTRQNGVISRMTVFWTQVRSQLM